LIQEQSWQDVSVAQTPLAYKCPHNGFG